MVKLDVDEFHRFFVRRTEAIAKFKGRQALFSQSTVSFRLILRHSSACMELPSSRELELEILLRERDAQLTELTVRSCFENGVQQHPDPLYVAYRMKSRSYDNTSPNSQGHPLQTQFLFLPPCCLSFYLISIVPRPKILAQTLSQLP